jgi:hypothetical protein
MSVHNIKTEVMESEDIYIGRGGHGQSGYFGNPYSCTNGFGVIKVGSRDIAIRKFEEYARDRIERDAEYMERVRNLFGKRLFCFCAPKPCHGNVLEKISKELNQ